MPKLFGANRPLLDKLSHSLGLPIGNAEFGSFPDGERMVRILEEVHGTTVILLQSAGPAIDSNILELAFLADAARRAGAKKILAIIPYFGYARSERLAASGSPIAARFIAEIFALAGISGLVTLDLHASAIVGFFNLPVEEVSAMPVFAEFYSKASLADYLVLSPDAGGIRRAGQFASKVGLPLGVAIKHRLTPTTPRIIELCATVENRRVILCDDIISTGGTLAEVAKLAYQHGAKSVEAVATHAVFAPGALERIKEAGIQRITVTDSLEPQTPGIEIISIAEAIALALKKLLPETND